jgi:hypothetical protein
MEGQAQGVKAERASFAFARLTVVVLPGDEKLPCNPDMYISVDHFATCFTTDFTISERRQ